eukprot:CAMPEP_0118926698 /NCGR_PEP_ID=MMETSP1169-20130426/4326_1 /TAXON_ID=36882 /ORGANISM="Pyramimonas obovata, Strain CCMP722" /LENGTH=407 /DNA_ID=CAMNT_0006868299 /DNA_START=340 /DNA_END=1563 /DNA_ORIENTATION=-
MAEEKPAEPPATEEGAPKGLVREKPGAKDPHHRSKLIIKEFQEAQEGNLQIQKKLEAARERRLQRNKPSVDHCTTPITLLSTQPTDKKSWKAEWALSNPQEVCGSVKQHQIRAQEAMAREQEEFQKELANRRAADEKRRQKREEEAIARAKKQEERKKHMDIVHARVYENRRKIVEKILEKKTKRELSCSKTLEEVTSKRNAKLEAMHNTEATRYTSVVTKLMAGEEAQKQKILAKFEVNRAKRNVDHLKEKFFPALYERLAAEHQKEEAYRQKLLVMEEEEKEKRQVAFQKTLAKVEHAAANRSVKVEDIQKRVISSNERRTRNVDVALQKSVEEHAKKVAELDTKETHRLAKLEQAKKKQVAHQMEVLQKQREVVIFRDLVEDLAIRTAMEKRVAEIIPVRAPSE